MKKYKWVFLGLIFLITILIRFYNFRENTYFGFDEARDAFVSQAIYRQGDFKLIGPPANGATGLNHGVLHWYLVGIVYLIGGGSPYFVSLVYRFLNGLAIFPIFWITDKLVGKRAGYVAALLFAFSFEATQYAMYVGNPSLAIFSWISLFAGAVVIYKMKNKFWGLPLMSLGITTGAQFELPLITLVFVGLVILGLLRREVKRVNFKSWATAVILGIGIISPYILGELKNGFRSIAIIFKMIASGHNLSSTESKWGVYVKRWILIWHDNFLPLNGRVLWLVVVIIAGFWVFHAWRKIEYRLILTWIFGGVFVFMIGTNNSYYINVGIGTGLIIGLAAFLDKILNLNKYLGIVLILFALAGNLFQIYSRNSEGLNEDIKAQQFMLLSDEIRVINRMYTWADKKSFTIRVTSMPYSIQTVWAYLFDQYGKPHFGYLPYYETGNVLGYPGYLPQPKRGTTCVRFYLREPIGGIPMTLVQKDINNENYFSNIENTLEIGHFYLEKRISKDKKCLSDNFP